MENIHKININKTKEKFKTRLETSSSADLEYLEREFTKLITLEENINKCLTNDTKSKIELGGYLNEIKESFLYKLSEYESFESYCLFVIGISKRYAYRLIEVFNFKKSVDIDTIDFTQFTISQLQEILYLPSDKLELVSPSMTILEIRQLKYNCTSSSASSDHGHCNCEECHTPKPIDLKNAKIPLARFQIDKRDYKFDDFTHFSGKDLTVIAYDLYTKLNYYRDLCEKLQASSTKAKKPNLKLVSDN